MTKNGVQKILDSNLGSSTSWPADSWMSLSLSFSINKIGLFIIIVSFLGCCEIIWENVCKLLV